MHFCSWAGIVCGQKHKRVVQINLASSKLSGQLSPAIGNLSFLTQLDLKNNSFTGIIPEEMGQLSRLRILSLANNSFSGEMPKNVSRCSELWYLNLGGNQLRGRIPAEWQALSRLQYLELYLNNLTGEIPSYIGNFSSLIEVSCNTNNLHGKIPDSLGQLRNVISLNFGLNNISGTIPNSIFNLSSLVALYLVNNSLQGHIPSNIGFTLPNLKVINIGRNKLEGKLPASISNCTQLLIFEADTNDFTGGVPDFGGLENLTALLIAGNRLGNGKSDDLNFLSSLLNCTQLKLVDLQDCNLGGQLPKYIGNFSKLEGFAIGMNVISGEIPTEIGQLLNLQILVLRQNQLSGAIPDSIGKLQRLYRLELDNNRLSGEIPSSLGNISNLGRLSLQKNNLQGAIPVSLGKCKLSLFHLYSNNISGNMPKELFSLTAVLITIDLSDNRLTGAVPTEVGNLKNLDELLLSSNRLSGEMPLGLGKLTDLSILHLDNNFLGGSIPQSLRTMVNLQDLDLSRNNLQGEIPEFLSQLRFLAHLNLSFNDLEGEVPTKGIFESQSAISIDGNEKLCGGIPQLELPKCTRKSHKAIIKLVICISVGTLACTLLAAFLFIYRQRKKPPLPEPSGIDNITRMSYRALHKATNGFSEENLIGSGKFSSVYKGTLDETGTAIAVKVLKLQVKGASKTFLAECEALRQMRHRNLVKVLTSCSSIDHHGNDFKAIVYKYMENGSLEKWLHRHENKDVDESHVARRLNMSQRLNIAIDVACGLEYLHHQFGTPLIHCDLKPSNILLDNNFVAHLSDFGLARFLVNQVTSTLYSSEDSSAGIKGTIGYVAPGNFSFFR